MRYHAWIRMSMCAERRREQILNNMRNNCLCVFVVVYVVLALQEVHASININSLSFLLTATYCYFVRISFLRQLPTWSWILRYGLTYSNTPSALYTCGWVGVELEEEKKWRSVVVQMISSSNIKYNKKNN